MDLNSALAEDLEIVTSLFDFQEINESPIKIQKPNWLKRPGVGADFIYLQTQTQMAASIWGCLGLSIN